MAILTLLAESRWGLNDQAVRWFFPHREAHPTAQQQVSIEPNVSNQGGFGWLIGLYIAIAYNETHGNSTR